jgi:CBS domain containing-hemolysin-like protein
MIEIALLFVSLIMVVLCGFFVAAEFSLLAVDRATVERKAERGNKSAKGVLQALKSLSTQLSGAQLGITITNLVIGFLAQPALAQLLHGPLKAAGIPESAVDEIALLCGLALATAATMVFGELVPKNMAIARPLATARFVQRFQRNFTQLMRGPIAILNNSANFILRRMGVEPQEELASARSADELLSLVRRSAEKGTLSKATAVMMERSLTFGDLTALDVMTSRLRMRTVSKKDSVQAIIDVAQATGLSRFPVTGEHTDDIVGIAHIKQAIATPHDQRQTIRVQDVMAKPVFVPSGLQLEPLLEQLRSGGMQMAVVIDEFGGTDGIVTIEDLLEELVGEVQDEHDRSKASAIRRRSATSWMLSGLLRPDEIGEEIGIYLPEQEEYETIGGLMAHKLEHIPQAKDSTAVMAVDRSGNSLVATLTVERMDGHRVDRIHLLVTPSEEAS